MNCVVLWHHAGSARDATVVREELHTDLRAEITGLPDRAAGVRAADGLREASTDAAARLGRLPLEGAEPQVRAEEGPMRAEGGPGL